ncbi:MAG: hypothetical protein NUV56_03305 [Candidatus Uhrbacteria bacterium]|nr:hypothetical protein [Candidatus Uhrbacteria bacterium]
MITINPAEFNSDHFLLLMHTAHSDLFEKARALFPMIPNERVFVVCRDRAMALAYTGIGRAVMQCWDDAVEAWDNRIDNYYDACKGGVEIEPMIFFPDTTHGDIMRMMRPVTEHESGPPRWFSMSADGSFVE